MQFDKIASFIQGLFQNTTGSLSRQEILDKSQQSDLTTDDKSVFNELPDKSYNKDDLMSTVKGIFEKRGLASIKGMFK
jgi:hypothetical protein